MIYPPYRSKAGFTLLELSMVICVLLALITVGLKASSSYQSWKLGRLASETLRATYSAQRTFLADNPTRRVDSLTQADLLPYMPNNPATFPTLTALNKSVLYVRVNVSPPTASQVSGTAGAAYDPSGSSTDSLWDVGDP